MAATSNPRHCLRSTRSVAIPVCRVTGSSRSAGPREIRFQPAVQLLDSAAGDLFATLEPIEHDRFVRARHAGDRRHVGAQRERFRCIASGVRRHGRWVLSQKLGEGLDSGEGRGIAVVDRELPTYSLIERGDAPIGIAANLPHRARCEPALGRTELRGAGVTCAWIREQRGCRAVESLSQGGANGGRSLRSADARQGL